MIIRDERGTSEDTTGEIIQVRRVSNLTYRDEFIRVSLRNGYAVLFTEDEFKKITAEIS